MLGLFDYIRGTEPDESMFVHELFNYFTKRLGIEAEPGKVSKALIKLIISQKKETLDNSFKKLPLDQYQWCKDLALVAKRLQNPEYILNVLKEKLKLP